MKITNARIFWNIIWLLASIVLVWVWFPMIWILAALYSIFYIIAAKITRWEEFREQTIVAGLANISYIGVIVIIFKLADLSSSVIKSFNNWLNKPKKQKPSYPPIDKGERHRA